MIEFSAVGGKELGDLIGKIDSEKMRTAVRKGLELVGRTIATQAVDNNGARPGPFVQTGRLRSSITHKVASDGMSVVIGSSVEYAPRLELGFKGQENVKSHQRKISQVFGNPISGGPKTITVKAFTREANTPAYPFLRPAFDYALRIKIVEDMIGDQLNALLGAE